MIFSYSPCCETHNEIILLGYGLATIEATDWHGIKVTELSVCLNFIEVFNLVTENIGGDACCEKESNVLINITDNRTDFFMRLLCSKVILKEYV